MLNRTLAVLGNSTWGTRAPILLCVGIIAGGSLGTLMDMARSSRVGVTRDAAATAAFKGDVAPMVAAGVGALGRVEPASGVRRIAPPATITVNRIDRLLVKEGDDVAAGQLLGEFADAAAKHLAVEEADASLAEARAVLTLVRAAGRPDDIAAQREHVASLSVQSEMSRTDAARAETLVPSGAGARAVAERAESAASRAAADLREAEARLVSLSTPRPEDVLVAEAKVRSAQAASARARGNAALSQIFAPMSGKILKIHARPGDLVGSEGVLELGDLDELDVVADVYQSDLSRVHVGARAEVILPGSTIRYPAQVHEIGWLVKRGLQAGTDPVAAVDARTVEVRLRLEPAGVAGLRQRINSQVEVAIQP
jgi:HlyD family secretion protein